MLMHSGIWLAPTLSGPSDTHRDLECDILFVLDYSAGVWREFKLMRVCKQP